jgi:hypothetical protein
MGDLGELWNSVKDTASIFENNQSVHVGSYAFACPKGLQPNDLDWSHGSEMQLQADELEWTNWAKETLGLSSGSKLRIGAIWTYGGSTPQYPGLYLANAHLYAVLEYSSAGTDFTVTGEFGEPMPRNNSAELPCKIRVDKKQFYMHVGTWEYTGKIRGDGSGYFWPV